MRMLELQKATRSLREYAKESQQEPIVITSRGKAMAVLLPIENADMEAISLSTNPKFIAIIERSRQRHKKEGGISSDEMRRRLGVPKRKRA